MAFEPGRRPLVHNQPGNPLYGQPSLEHPAWNPSGLLPGTPTTPRGVEAWCDNQGQRFASDGTNQVWTWESPVFDLRPALSAAYGIIPSAVPINHEAAIGQSVYLVLIVGESSGVSPPAASVGISADYWEDGNGCQADNGQLFRLSQVVPCTTNLLAGGVSIVAPFGASAISITPCVTSLRFWKVSFRLTFAGVAAVARPYFIQASLH